MTNLQTYYHLKLDFQKVDQHTGGEWLIHGTKRRKDNQLQSHGSMLRIGRVLSGWIYVMQLVGMMSMLSSL